MVLSARPSMAADGIARTDTLTDAVSREFTVFNNQHYTVAFTDAVSREFTVFNNQHYTVATTDAVSREFTVFNNQHYTVAFTDGISREFTVFNNGSFTVAITDAVSREFTVYNDIVTAAVAPPVPLELFQNHPNPFNPTTTIRFGLPKAAHATLEIYDVGGRLVRTLVDSALPAKLHAIEWNGRNNHGTEVASGIYLYKLRVENKTFVKKMMLLK